MDTSYKPYFLEVTMRHGWTVRITLILAAVLLLAGCQAAYYEVWEKFGKEKRHLLKETVEKAGKDQENASQEFENVLTRIKTLYGFEGGDLEAFYDRLKDEYEVCKSRSETVSKRVAQVEQIAMDLFEEWQLEIDTISNEKLKTKSRASLLETRSRYKKLQNAMVRAESSMKPVLTGLNDYVLYLKHNLNAQAINSLKNEIQSIELEVSALIKDMDRSVKASQDFLKTFE
jgi:hypothetical protein